MSMTIGTRLGPYEIVAPLGAGGMGVVFRAHDTRLKRDVAVKMLPPEFAVDSGRVARFQREAELLATLAHQNIAALYGLEESGDVRALIMELVEGDTLAQRIASGPIPVDEAIALARQLAEALDYAHERGVLHRDLKPDNIKVTEDGRLKVLDFGLAKAIERSGQPGSAGAAAPPDLQPLTANLEHLPTLISPPPVTAVGVILGTAAYMAPEQTRGKTVDKRADIWAFGCVLFEMLAGRRAFDGESVADVLAAVMTREPELQLLPATVPPSLAALTRRCLQKDPKHRLRDIGDALVVLDGAEGSAPSVAKQLRPSQSAVRRALPWAVAAAGLAAAAAAVLIEGRSAREAGARLVRVEARAGAEVSLVNDQGPAAVLSPDGSMMAFVGRKAGRNQLFIRHLDELDATLIPGTEGALIPFFSPDGQWIAFFATGKLKKVRVAGGTVIALCDAPTGRGGSWGNDNRIVFTPNASGGTGLLRVSANGGIPETLTKPRENEAAHRWPQVLPGARGVIYSTTSTLGNFNDGNIVVQPLPGGDAKVVLKGGYFGRYMKSGHLTYVHDGRLFAVRFDIDRLETIGSPVPVLEHVVRSVQTGVAQFDVSETGTAVYMADDVGRDQPFQWLTRDGTITSLKAAPSDWSNPRLSPDGQRVAVDRFDGQQTDVWIYDWVRDVATQLTFDPGEDWMPVWTPDGGRVVFRSNRRQFAFNLHWQRSDGGRQSEALTSSRHPSTPGSWHPNGDVFAYIENNPVTNYDIMLLPLNQKGGSPTGEPRPFLNSAAQEVTPAFSPDGHWIAYVSNESGRNGVYVRPYPGPGGQRLIAAEGTDPTWSRARHELVYLAPDQRLMVAAYTVEGDSFHPETPRPWASAKAVVRTRGLVGFDGREYDLHPDGERAIGAWSAESTPEHLQNTVLLAFNFFEELRRLAPAGR